MAAPPGALMCVACAAGANLNGTADAAGSGSAVRLSAWPRITVASRRYPHLSPPSTPLPQWLTLISQPVRPLSRGLTEERATLQLGLFIQKLSFWFCLPVGAAPCEQVVHCDVENRLQGFTRNICVWQCKLLWRRKQNPSLPGTCGYSSSL